MSKCCFGPADILLPDFSIVDGEKWAVIACDQFTSQPEYWTKAKSFAGEAPTVLNLILPEAYLSETDKMLPCIKHYMNEYLNGLFLEHKNTMIYVKRTISDGRVRRGIVGALDLECYDWHPETEAQVRATEGTVPERIPPRVKIRKSAPLELPHIMLLIDDPDCDIIEYFDECSKTLDKAYDFELMLGGGHIGAWFLNKQGIDILQKKIEALATPELTENKYNVKGKKPLVIAVGDGNHSLATAKAVYEDLKREIGPEAARRHPARYALAELTNIHDAALDFEPIFRVVFNAEPEELIADFKEYCRELKGEADLQTIKVIWQGNEEIISVKNPEHQNTVGTLQNFLDRYLITHKGTEIDYIHGRDETVELSSKHGAVGFIFEGMSKDLLFKSVLCDGSLPRKTFSMGHAEDKRYYIEARKILK